MKYFRKLNPHIDEHDALKMVKILQPQRYAIPIHFGFYPMINVLKQPTKLQKLLEEEGLGHLFLLLKNGETIEL